MESKSPFKAGGVQPGHRRIRFPWVHRWCGSLHAAKTGNSSILWAIFAQGASPKTSQIKKCARKNWPRVDKNKAEWNPAGGLLCSAAHAGCVDTVPRDKWSCKDPHPTPSAAVFATQGTPGVPSPRQGLCSFCGQQGVKPVREQETQATRPPATVAGRGATQGLGVYGQKVKLPVLASLPSLPGPYPSGGSLCVQKQSRQLRATEHKASPPPWRPTPDTWDRARREFSLVM